MNLICKYEFVYSYFLSTFEFLTNSTISDKGLYAITMIPTFEFNTLQVMRPHLTFNDIENCFNELGKFLDELERNNKMLYKLDIDQIYVAYSRDTFKYSFFIVNFEDILPIQNEQIRILFPFKKHAFISDYLRDVDTIPVSISYKGIYYNLAMIIYWLLFDINHFSLANLSQYNNTKLYACFFRCIDGNMEERQFIWI